MNGDREVMYLIKRINGNVILQSYMQEVSAEIFDILQRLAMYQAVSLPVEKSVHYHGIARDYEDCMSLLVRLGTTQKSIDSGSIFHESVAEVLLVGNIRERYGVFWNFFVNSSQRYNNIFAQLLQYTDNTHNCLHQVPPSAYGVDSTARSVLLNHAPQQERHTFTTPPCIKVERFEQIRIPAALNCAHSNTMARNLSLLKRYIGSLPGKTRKECRFPQQRVLHGHDGPKDCGETCMWKTGHMTWEMQNGSVFAQEAKKRQESTLAGPFGHTHRLLNAMKILNNFDLEK